MVVAIPDLSDEQLAAEAAREGSGRTCVRGTRSIGFRTACGRVCYRLMGNAEDASDATQEVFVRLFLQRAQFEGRSKYTTWMHGIAIRTCLMMRRGRGRRRKHEEVAQQQGTERHERSHRDTREASLDLAQMLDTLDEEDRAMLILKYAEGHNYEELSEMFDLTVSGCQDAAQPRSRPLAATLSRSHLWQR